MLLCFTLCNKPHDGVEVCVLHAVCADVERALHPSFFAVDNTCTCAMSSIVRIATIPALLAACLSYYCISWSVVNMIVHHACSVSQ